MNDSIITKNDELVMKLLHYFITERGYNPIVLHGAQNEIWLENLDQDYKIIRIVSNYIHNNEQLDFDLFRTKQIMKRIKKKTFSLSMNALSIFVNLGDNVHIDDNNLGNNITGIKVNELEDLNKYPIILNIFPDLNKESDYNEDGFNLFMKLTKDINEKNEEESKKAEDIFTKKTPIITYILIIGFFLRYLIQLLSI